MNQRAVIDASTLRPASARYDVELVSVSKSYSGALAVDNISLRIPKAS